MRKNELVRERQVGNDEICDIESLESKLCPYPVCEGRNSEPCRSAARIEDRNIADVGGSLPPKANKRSSDVET
jgi:hypothetical protein